MGRRGLYLMQGDAWMDDPQIYGRLQDIFRSVFDDESINLAPQLSANDVDDWDSLTHIRLIMTVQKEFKDEFAVFGIAVVAPVSA